MLGVTKDHEGAPWRQLILSVRKTAPISKSFSRLPVRHHDLGLQRILTVFRGEALARIVHEKGVVVLHYYVIIQLVTQEQGGDTLIL